ncbi:MAG: ketopantoate reductase C-terminal domain-containing protein [Idiomarina sp.]
MSSAEEKPIYVIGAGAIGFPLAACLTLAGRSVVAVRSSRSDISSSVVAVTMHHNGRPVSVAVKTISLNKLPKLDGIVVIASKSYANKAIADALKEKSVTGPVVVMQNGIGVEQAFIDAGFSNIYRCVLYLTSQSYSEYDFSVTPVRPSPIGIVNGNEFELSACIAKLHTENFPFCRQPNIHREVWKKTIVNVAFNSICPLLGVDNGIFIRDTNAAKLARELVQECLLLLSKLDIDLEEAELMTQIMTISSRSDGLYISTLQDINTGRPTEIEFLNLEIARIARALSPSLELPKIELLGNMIAAKSQLGLKVK